MSWTKVKKRLDEFITPRLRGRVQFYITSYRRDEDGNEDLGKSLGRAWVTLDGIEILSISGKVQRATEHDTLSRQEFYEILANYPDQPFNHVLESPMFLVRGLALIDRRLGKRRLMKFNVEDEGGFVKTLYSLRCELENIPRASEPIRK